MYVPESSPVSPAAPSALRSLLRLLRLWRVAGPELLKQVELHGHLARLEWAEEKRRLLRLVLFAGLAFACLLSLLLVFSALLLALSWATPYQWSGVLAVVAVHGLGLLLACWRLKALIGRSTQSFAATREELAAEVVALRQTI